MSKRIAGTSQFVVKHKYLTPTPAPPFPPKLFDISTPINRFVNYGHASILANETPLPMAIDSELGMPLDLSQLEGVFLGDMSALIADTSKPPILDPEDLNLLEEPTGSAATISAGIVKPKALVPWLRRTEYISSEASKHARPESIESRFAFSAKRSKDLFNLNTNEGQLAAIETSFEAIQKTKDISKLRHPLDPTLHAVEAFNVHPDFATWSNMYSLFQFQTDPMEHVQKPIVEPIADQGSSKSRNEPDLRPEYAVFRPMSITEQNGYIAYFLPDEEGAKNWKRRRVDRVESSDDRISFKHVRDYDNNAIVIDPPLSELVFTLGKDETGQPSALYSNIMARVVLRKRRARKGGRIRLPNFVSSIDLGKRDLQTDELEKIEMAKIELEQGPRLKEQEEMEPEQQINGKTGQQEFIKDDSELSEDPMDMDRRDDDDNEEEDEE